MSYNGWSSYETWVVKLWMDNEESSQEYWREQTEEQRLLVLDDGKSQYHTTREAWVWGLEEALKAHHETTWYDLAEGMMQPCVYSDLMGASLESVNWREIAESLIDEWVEERVWQKQEARRTKAS